MLHVITSLHYLVKVFKYPVIVRILANKRSDNKKVTFLISGVAGSIGLRVRGLAAAAEEDREQDQAGNLKKEQQ